MSNVAGEACDPVRAAQSPLEASFYTPPPALSVTMSSNVDACHHIPLVVLAGPNTDQFHMWRAHLSSCGYAVVIVDDLAKIPLPVQPDALVIDADLLSTEELDAFRYQWSASTPLVIIAERDDIATRLQAVRVGADSFLPFPVDPVRLVEDLDRLTLRLAPEPYCVIIVSDTPHACAAPLSDAGMLLYHVADPAYLLQDIEAFAPDILLIDMHLANYASFELAAVVRQQSTFVSLPIVFLAGAGDQDLLAAPLWYGDNDVLFTPLAAEHLIAAVSNRVERARVMRNYIARDGLTGLPNRSTIMARLLHEIVRAERCQTPLSIAMLDVDRFKAVNDTYGHMAGDQVLKSLARVLRQRLRATDSIGRYGGEEFMVILPGADGHAAQHVLEKILRNFGQLCHHNGHASWHTTFSCGIASMQQHGAQYIAVADAALYTAKHNGRNQIVLGNTSERANVVAR